jgi:hypothetical protein
MGQGRDQLLDFAETKRLGLVNDLVKQLIKDFNLSGLDLVPVNDPLQAYDALYILVMKHVQDQFGKPAFMRVLNRVDISESQFKAVMQASRIKDPVEAIAILIMKRELQKVVIRSYHSGA